VLVLRLVTRGTIEERIMRVAHRKLALEDTIVRPLTATLSAMEIREVIRAGAMLPEESEARSVRPRYWGYSVI
jgi:SNF2 family DNA or RNA helicase